MAASMRLRGLAHPIVLALAPFLFPACAGGDPDSAEAEDAATEEAGTLESAKQVDGSVAGGLLNPNDASSDELATVAGMAPEAAAALEAGRPYASMSDVHAVLSGVVGEEAALATYESLWLPISLNDAARDEILLIPGVGDRMAHEFEEYRPYADMEQFRREIGKYVDEDEVARLERYVTLD